MQKLVIATRQSPLALWQAEYVKSQLEHYHKNLEVKLLKMTTEGDKKLTDTLAKIGGKGLFIKELEVAMQDGLADIAVHSAKDIPYRLSTGFTLGAILKRENPHDAFVSNQYSSITDLPQGAKVGTCSLRRQVQLLAIRPDLAMIDLRGNVNTRLQKLDSGQYDAIILACAGLIRLGFVNRIKQQISVDVSLPAVGQGAVGIEIRRGDKTVQDFMMPLIDKDTTACVLAERAMNTQLEGSCSAPIGGFASINNDRLTLSGLVGDMANRCVIKASASGEINQVEDIGHQVAKQLFVKGARDLLKTM